METLTFSWSGVISSDGMVHSTPSTLAHHPNENSHINELFPFDVLELLGEELVSEFEHIEKEIEIAGLNLVVRSKKIAQNLFHLMAHSKETDKDKIIFDLEQRLVNSRQNFNDALTALPGAYFQYELYEDGTEKVLHVSPKCVDLWEVSEEEILESPSCIWELIVPEDLEEINKTVQRSAETLTTWNQDYRIVTRSGKLKWIRAVGQPSKAMEKPGVRWQTLAFDITDRKAMELEIERLALAASHSTNAIMILDVDGKIEWVNPAFESMSGYEETELKGQQPLDLLCGNLTNPNDISTFNSILKSKVQGRVEILQYHKSGQAFWNEVYLAPVFDDSNQLVNYVGIQNDVTERKVNHDRLHRSLELTQQQNERLQNFNYIVSHNLQSQAANIKALISEFASSDDEIQELLSQSVGNLLETLGNLNETLQVQKSTALPMHPLLLKQTIQKVLTSLHSQREDARAEVQMDFDEVEIPFYPAYFESICFNMVSNALKYRSPDRVPQIRIEHEKTEMYHVVRFIDNGLGIDLNKFGDKIFGMYKTFHDHPDSKGFGLFITKNQIEGLGGKIEVESEVGVGSTFTVYFLRRG